MSKTNASTAALTTFAILSVMVIGPAFASETDKEQVKSNFKSADANGDDKLDSNEFKTFIDLNAQYGIGRASTVRRFGAYATALGKADANSDGFVTREEVQNAAANQ